MSSSFESMAACCDSGTISDSVAFVVSNIACFGSFSAIGGDCSVSSSTTFVFSTMTHPFPTEDVPSSWVLSLTSSSLLTSMMPPSNSLSITDKLFGREYSILSNADRIFANSSPKRSKSSIELVIDVESNDVLTVLGVKTPSFFFASLDGADESFRSSSIRFGDDSCSSAAERKLILCLTLVLPSPALPDSSGVNSFPWTCSEWKNVDRTSFVLSFVADDGVLGWDDDVGAYVLCCNHSFASWTF
mmetsp:Transcript_29694/g.71900  ORF Transcript_29694/g.71900 Transcript_29694/m.71900 type:complete len:245 (-) Transcript_29694:377-1111(-)